MKATITIGSYSFTFVPRWLEASLRVSKFKLGTEAAKSMRTQRKYLAAAKRCLSNGNVEDAQTWLGYWKEERAYYAHMCLTLGNGMVSMKA